MATASTTTEWAGRGAEDDATGMPLERVGCRLKERHMEGALLPSKLFSAVLPSCVVQFVSGSTSSPLRRRCAVNDDALDHFVESINRLI